MGIYIPRSHSAELARSSWFLFARGCVVRARSVKGWYLGGLILLFLCSHANSALVFGNQLV